ncbi:hypothetical protein NIA69_14810 [Gemmiger formicilis]|nr:hypothetical protein [Gemmiger formicilis]
MLAQPWDGKITCALAGAGVFILLALAARCWTARGPARWAHSLPKYPTRCSLCITF